MEPNVRVWIGETMRDAPTFHPRPIHWELLHPFDIPVGETILCREDVWEKLRVRHVDGSRVHDIVFQYGMKRLEDGWEYWEVAFEKGTEPPVRFQHRHCTALF